MSKTEKTPPHYSTQNFSGRKMSFPGFHSQFGRKISDNLCHRLILICQSREDITSYPFLLIRIDKEYIPSQPPESKKDLFFYIFHISESFFLAFPLRNWLTAYFITIFFLRSNSPIKFPNGIVKPIRYF